MINKEHIGTRWRPRKDGSNDSIAQTQFTLEVKQIVTSVEMFNFEILEAVEIDHRKRIWDHIYGDLLQEVNELQEVAMRGCASIVHAGQIMDACENLRKKLEFTND